LGFVTKCPQGNKFAHSQVCSFILIPGKDEKERIGDYNGFFNEFCFKHESAGTSH
jgi:hypothetical protein